MLLLVGLVGLEGLAQVTYRVSRGHWLVGRQPFQVDHMVRQDDKRAYAYRPGYRSEVEGLTIDERGFRASPEVGSPAPGAEVIAVLGDSVPFGHGVRDDETYPHALGSLLRAAGSPVAVVNAGVQSYNLQQSIERFYRDVLAHYRPLAITLQTANDVALLLTYRAGWTPESTWAPYRPTRLFAVGSSAILHYLAPLIGVLGAVLPQSLFGYPMEEMLANEERLLRELIDVCRSTGTTLVLLPINPFYYQTAERHRNEQLSRWAEWQGDPMGWGSAIERFNEVLLRVAREAGPDAGVHVFDVRAYLDALDREPLYTDSIHHSPEGNRRVAEGLFAFLKAERILPP